MALPSFLNTDKRRCARCSGACFMGSYYCVAHKCRKRCNNPREGSSEFCRDHRCTACDAGALLGCRVCVAHKCAEEGCSEARAGSSEYCKEHRCEKCSAARVKGTRYCPAHLCAGQMGCLEPRMEGGQACPAHASLSFPTEGTPKGIVVLGSYELGPRLGCGAFSQVRSARHTVTGDTVAVKLIERHGMHEDLVASEISLLTLLSGGAHVIKIVEAFRTQKCVGIVMENATGGELFELIEKSPHGVEEGVARSCFGQVMSGVAFLHSRSVAHRDLKPENILLLEDGTVRIVDFGFAAFQAAGKKLHEPLGTPEYQAPEVRPNNPYDGFAADIWSCGIILFALVQGVQPFQGEDEEALQEAVAAGIPPYEGTPPSGATSLIERLLVTDSERRPLACEVVSDPWLGGGTSGPGPPPNDVPPPPPDNPQAFIRSLPIASPVENEHLIFHHAHRTGWSLSNFLEETANFIGTLGKTSPGPPVKALPQRALIRPQGRWRRA